jgi:hypothetical protein
VSNEREIHPVPTATRDEKIRKLCRSNSTLEIASIVKTIFSLVCYIENPSLGRGVSKI